jgi:hypothetical protein
MVKISYFEIICDFDCPLLRYIDEDENEKIEIILLSKCWLEGEKYFAEKTFNY